MPHPESDPHNLPQEIVKDTFYVTFNTWQHLPTIVRGTEVFQKAKILFDPQRTPEITSFLDITRQKAIDFRKAGQYGQAIALLSEALKQVPIHFEGDHQLTVNRFLYYRAGHTFEHLATFGDVSKLPYTDEKRILCFLQAATCYMQADIPFGHISDYAMRVWESLGGAGLPFAAFREVALSKFADKSSIVIGPNDIAGQVMAASLKKMATETRKGVIPGGGNAFFIAPEDLPPTNVN